MLKFNQFYLQLALILLLAAGCVSTGPAPTAGITTTVAAPPTATPYPLPQTYTSPDGALTVRYPADWTAGVLGRSVSLSSTVDLASQVTQRTFAPDEIVILIDYANRADVAAALGLDANFTLEQLGAANEVAESTETIQLNGKPTVAQVGLIELEGIAADVYALTFEVDGVLVTVTAYGGPRQIEKLKPLTQGVAVALVLDASLVSGLADG
ncbi:MAG: hypothetical protein H7X77_03225 [Anaerolineae bacterium]|nr:hypothetical protein [Anaerolineae bacterium]